MTTKISATHLNNILNAHRDEIGEYVTICEYSQDAINYMINNFEDITAGEIVAIAAEYTSISQLVDDDLIGEDQVEEFTEHFNETDPGDELDSDFVIENGFAGIELVKLRNKHILAIYDELAEEEVIDIVNDLYSAK